MSRLREKKKKKIPVNSAVTPLLSAQHRFNKKVFSTENKPDLLEEKLQDCEAEITHAEEVTVILLCAGVCLCGCASVRFPKSGKACVGCVFGGKKRADVLVSRCLFCKHNLNQPLEREEGRVLLV